MSHNINYFDYPENVDKNKVINELETYVSHEAWQEGGHLGHIRWIPGPVCESRDDAVKYIEAHDKGWYDCLAVRYLEPDFQKKSKAYIELQQRYKKAYDRYSTLNEEEYASTVKSAFIGCKTCGSKLSRKHILERRHGAYSNFCPVCGADLRSPTMQDRIKKAREAMCEIQKKLEQEERHMAKRNGDIRWLVKIEFHT